MSRKNTPANLTAFTQYAATLLDALPVDHEADRRAEEHFAQPQPETTPLKLSRRDSAIFLALIESDEEPPEALVEAMRRHRGDDRCGGH